ncbi:unnamed protein product [Porites lobata]|uniref:Uncharacterized protein n=1 Tax=Porites lobata TaxID=104759 RepID=A0ABN8PPJ3_9CNID|nr:unnamed protein product [Porites lobata]
MKYGPTYAHRDDTITKCEDIIISLYVERDEESELKDPPTTSSGIQLETGWPDILLMHVASHQVLKSSFRDDDETCAKATIGMEKAAYCQCKQVLGGNWNYFED